MAIELPSISFPEDRWYDKFDGELKIASIAQDLSMAKEYINTLKLVVHDLQNIMFKHIVEQKRYDLLMVNWRRLQKVMMENL